VSQANSNAVLKIIHVDPPDGSTNVPVYSGIAAWPVAVTSPKLVLHDWSRTIRVFHNE
jgi:hypothetical protein